MELLADERLGLALVRRDEERLGLDPVAQRLAVAVEHDRDVAVGELVDQVGVELLGDLARQRAGEHDELGALREVGDLVAQHLELLGPHRPAPTR